MQYIILLTQRIDLSCVGIYVATYGKRALIRNCDQPPLFGPLARVYKCVECHFIIICTYSIGSVCNAHSIPSYMYVALTLIK